MWIKKYLIRCKIYLILSFSNIMLYAQSRSFCIYDSDKTINEIHFNDRIRELTLRKYNSNYNLISTYTSTWEVRNLSKNSISLQILSKINGFEQKWQIIIGNDGSVNELIDNDKRKWTPCYSEIFSTIKIGDLEIAEKDFGYDMFWDEATHLCEKLGMGWRLPTQDEMRIMFEHKDNLPGLFEGFNAYWTSTRFEYDNKSVYIGSAQSVNEIAYTDIDPFSVEKRKKTKLSVRAVRNYK